MITNTNYNQPNVQYGSAKDILPQQVTRNLPDAKPDTVELSTDEQKAQNKKKIVKKAIAWGLSIATVLAVTIPLNKNIGKIWKVGNSVDDFAKNNKILKNLSGFGEKIKKYNPLRKSKLFNDIKNVTKTSNRVQPKIKMAQQSGLGPKGIFSITVPDTTRNIAGSLKGKEGGKATFIEFITSLVGEKGKIAGKSVSEFADAYFDDFIDKDRFREFLNTKAVDGKIGGKSVSDIVAETFHLKDTNASFGFSIKKHGFGKSELSKFFQNAVGGKDVKIGAQTAKEVAEEYLSKMDAGANYAVSTDIINGIKEEHGIKSAKDLMSFLEKLKVEGKIGDKDYSNLAKNVDMGWFGIPKIKRFGIKGKSLKGNVGDSLMKFAMMNGQGAETKLGRFAQKAPLILCESIGNCINDKALIGIMIGATTLPKTFEQAQDAPKGQKARTAASELVGSAASWAVGTATAATIIYSGASLKNLQSKGVIASALRGVGKFFNMGLNSSSSVPARFLGGALRLLGVMKLSGTISAPISDGVNKVFGLPTSKQKAKAQQEEQMKALQELQKQQQEKDQNEGLINPKYMQNNTLGQVNNDQVQAQVQTPAQAPQMVQNNVVNNPNTGLGAIKQEEINTQADLFGLGKKNELINQEGEPERTYIPSSAPFQATEEKQKGKLNPQIQAALDKSEAIEKEVLKNL